MSRSDGGAAGARVLAPIRNGRALGLLADRAAPCFVVETSRTIGGVGRTLRWRYAATEHTDDQPVTVLLTNLASATVDEELAALPAGIARRTGDYEEAEADEEAEGTTLTASGDAWGLCTAIVVEDARNIMQVLAHLQRTQPMCRHVIDDATREHWFELGIERFDRSRWNFFNQTDDTAAPKQSWHKWTLSWIPTHWRVLPFTWRRLVANLDAETPDAAPCPLSDHMIEYRLERTDAEVVRRVAAGASERASERATARSLRSPFVDPLAVLRARARRWRRLRPAVRRVTAALTDAQARELLHALLVVRFLDRADPDHAAAVQTLEFYVRHGYTARMLGPYRQDARHVGYGHRPRTFRHLSQYNIEMLDVDVLSAIYQPDGSLKGRRSAVRARPAVAPRQMHNDAHYRTRLLEAAVFAPASRTTWATTSPDT